MTVHPLILVIGLSLFAFSGGFSLRQYSLTGEILWLVAGFCLYGLSNVLFIVVMDHAGLARAMVIAGAAQITLSALAGAFVFNETIGRFGWAAVGLACLAIVAAAVDQRAIDQRTIASSFPSQPTETPEEADHANVER